MATFLRTLSYRYQWLYDTISRLAALTVGGETRFRNLALQGLTGDKSLKILDLCCGAGQTTQFLTQYSDDVTGLDISPLAIERAKKNVPKRIMSLPLPKKCPCRISSLTWFIPVPPSMK